MPSALSAYSAELEKYLLEVDQLAVRNLIDKLLKECRPLDIIENLITPVLQKIGARWEKGDLALSQVYMSGRLCEEILPDLLPKAGSVPKNDLKIAIAVLEDYHTLGKRIVYTLSAFLRLQRYRLRTWHQSRGPGPQGDRRQHSDSIDFNPDVALGPAGQNCQKRSWINQTAKSKLLSAVHLFYWMTNCGGWSQPMQWAEPHQKQLKS